jgi:hypothetical protein
VVVYPLATTAYGTKKHSTNIHIAASGNTQQQKNTVNMNIRKRHNTLFLNDFNMAPMCFLKSFQTFTSHAK